MLKKKVNQDWFEGSVGSQAGLFPASFVKVLVPLEDSVFESLPTSAPNLYRAVAMYSFQAETSQDLSLKVKFSPILLQFIYLLEAVDVLIVSSIDLV